MSAAFVCMELLRVDAVSADEAEALLRTCCGASRWVQRMVAARPFGTRDRLLEASRVAWHDLEPGDWLEAFQHHPKIGDRDALRATFADTRHLAAREQAGVDGAPEAILSALAIENERYQQKFGFIFIVCATGLTADEMLARLRARIPNDPVSELQVAAGEQAKITALRLSRL